MVASATTSTSPSYRIRRMPDVPQGLDTMKVRKALTAMSVCAVSTSWLRSVAGLSQTQLIELLRTLDRQKVLLGPFDGNEPAMQVPQQHQRQHRSAWKEIRDFLTRSVLSEGSWLKTRMMFGSPTARDRAGFFRSTSVVDKHTSPWVEDLGGEPPRRFAADLYIPNKPLRR